MPTFKRNPLLHVALLTGVSQTFNARKNHLRTARRDACSPPSTRSVKRFDGPDIAPSDRSAPMLGE